VTIFIGLSQESRRKEKVSIDYAGVVTLVVSVVSLLLGLSLGGKDYPWNSWQIIGLFIIPAFIYAGSSRSKRYSIRKYNDTNDGCFPVVEKIPSFKTGALGSMMEKSNTDPQGLLNALLRPETLKMLPPQLQQIIVSSLKIALADSLHLVLLVRMELLAEGVNGEITVPAEVEPDIIEDTDK